MIKLLGLRPRTRVFIIHEDVRHPHNGTAIFGPFFKFEIDKRLNDYYGDLLAYDGNIEPLDLTRKQAKNIYINSRRYWMKQLKEILSSESMTSTKKDHIR